MFKTILEHTNLRIINFFNGTEVHVSIDFPDVYRILNVLLLIKKRNFISQLDSCLLWYHVRNVFVWFSRNRYFGI